MVIGEDTEGALLYRDDGEQFFRGILFDGRLTIYLTLLEKGEGYAGRVCGFVVSPVYIVRWVDTLVALNFVRHTDEGGYAFCCFPIFVQGVSSLCSQRRVSIVLHPQLLDFW